MFLIYGAVQLIRTNTGDRMRNRDHSITLQSMPFLKNWGTCALYFLNQMDFLLPELQRWKLVSSLGEPGPCTRGEPRSLGERQVLCHPHRFCGGTWVKEWTGTQDTNCERCGNPRYHCHRPSHISRIVLVRTVRDSETNYSYPLI